MAATQFQPVPTYEDPASVNPRTGKFEFSPTWLSWFLSLTNGSLGGTVQHDDLKGLQGGVAGEFYHLTHTQYTNLPVRNLVAPSNVAPSSSPFLYTSADSFDEDLLITGGTVSKIEFSRDALTFYDTQQTLGWIHLSPGDSVRITYSVAPTITKVPR